MEDEQPLESGEGKGITYVAEKLHVEGRIVAKRNTYAHLQIWGLNKTTQEQVSVGCLKIWMKRPWCNIKCTLDIPLHLFPAGMGQNKFQLGIETSEGVSFKVIRLAVQLINKELLKKQEEEETKIKKLTLYLIVVIDCLQ